MRLTRTVPTCLLLATLLLATAALALDPPPPADDAILGLYTAPTFGSATENWVQTAAGEVVTIYVVLSYADFTSVGGVEFSLATDPPGAFGSSLVLDETILDASALMVTAPPDFVIGYGLPLHSTTGHHVALAQPILVLADAPVSLFLRPYNRPSLPGVMAYNNWFVPGDIQPMLPASAGHSHDQPVFGVNQQVVATAGMTWGAVKALFE